ncbi:MAG: hypothetical protein AAGD38_19385 [Acidobacteriota bacterium]
MTTFTVEFGFDLHAKRLTRPEKQDLYYLPSGLAKDSKVRSYAMLRRHDLIQFRIFDISDLTTGSDKSFTLKELSIRFEAARNLQRSTSPFGRMGPIITATLEKQNAKERSILFDRELDVWYSYFSNDQQTLRVQNKGFFTARYMLEATVASENATEANDVRFYVHDPEWIVDIGG